MEQEPIKYRDVINLGFRRTDDHDGVFYDQYGYDYFIVDLKVTKHIYFDWESTTRTVKMVRINKRFDILSEYPIKSLDELKQLVAFFKDKTYKAWDEYVQTMA